MTGGYATGVNSQKRGQKIDSGRGEGSNAKESGEKGKVPLISKQRKLRGRERWE